MFTWPITREQSGELGARPDLSITKELMAFRAVELDENTSGRPCEYRGKDVQDGVLGSSGVWDLPMAQAELSEILGKTEERAAWKGPEPRDPGWPGSAWAFQVAGPAGPRAGGRYPGTVSSLLLG